MWWHICSCMNSDLYSDEDDWIINCEIWQSASELVTCRPITPLVKKGVSQYAALCNQNPLTLVTLHLSFTVTLSYALHATVKC